MSSRVFRIFLSSTFGDFQAEREALRARVWPKLEHYCQSKNTAFEVVDLRWGVSEADGLSHETLRICLDEIAHCQNLSPKPNFLMLIGDRYGWRPLPTEILVGEFDAIATQLAGRQEDLELINRWYRRDDNAIPPHFKLLPRDEAHRSAAAWAKVEGSLIALLREAVQALGLTTERRERYFLSATHLEIVRGVLAIDNADEHVFAFIRNIEGIEKLTPTQLPAGRFTDFANGQPDKEAAQLRIELRAEIANAIPAAHRYNYQCQWTGEQKKPISTSHIDTLCADVENSLRNLIDRQLETLVGDPLDQEIDRHHKFASERVETFIGRESEINQLQAWVDQALTSSASSVGDIEQESEGDADDDESESQPGTPPLIIHGPGGVGKSAFMARALAAVQPDYPQAVIIRRFIGASPQSINLYAFLSDLLREIARRYGKPETLPEGSLKVLIDELPNRLAWATAEQPLILAIDALDQFDENFEAHHHQWLPREMPQHVTIVMSVLDGPVYESARQRYADSTDIKLPVFTHNEGGELLDATLLAGEDIAPGRKRRLTSDQRTAVLNSFAADGRPLYLKIAASFVRRWPSWMPAETLPDSLEGLIRLMVTRLHNVHGATIADRALDYLSASRFGVSDNEIRELLWRDPEAHAEFDQRKNKDQPDVDSLPPVIWSRIYFEIAPYLTAQSVDGALLHRFFHRIIGEEVARVCLADDASLVHSRIADYFASQPLFLGDRADKTPNLRKLMEEPWQRIHAGELDKADALITDFDFAMVKCQANRFDDLLEDYRLLVARIREQGISPSQRFSIWDEFIRTKAHIMRRGNDVWPSHKILLQLAMEHADDSQITLAAEDFVGLGKCSWNWLCKGNRKKAHSDSPCLSVMEGHTDNVDGVLRLPQGRLLSWCSDSSSMCGLLPDHSMRLWDEKSGKLIAVLDGHSNNVISVFTLANGLLLSWSSNEICLWNSLTGMSVSHIATHKDPIYGIQLLDDGRFLTWSENEIYIWDAKSGRLLVSMVGHVGTINGIEILKDERILSWSDENTLLWWDSKTGSLLNKLKGPLTSIETVRVLNNGKILSKVAGEDQTLKDGSNYRPCALCILSDEGWINFGDVTDEGNLELKEISSTRLVTWSPYDWENNLLRLWNTDSGELLAEMDGPSGTGSDVRVLANDRILSWSSNNCILIWNGQSGEKIAVLSGHLKAVIDIRVLEDGRILSWALDHTLRIWNAENGTPGPVMKGHTKAIRGTVVLANGNLLSWSTDGTLRIWNGETGVPIFVMKGHSRLVDGVHVLANGNIVSWSADNNLCLWEGSSGTLIATMSGHTAEIIDVKILDGGKIISYSRDNTIRMWNGETGEIVVIMEGHTDSINGLQLLEDGYFLSWSADKTLRLWRSNADSSADQETLSRVQDFYDIGNGKLVSWFDDNNLRLIDIKTGGVISVLSGHSAPIIDVRLLDNGRILSWSSDKTLRLWDKDTGTLVAEMIGHTNKSSFRVWVLRNGRLLSNSADKSMRLWDCESGKSIAVMRNVGFVYYEPIVLDDGRWITLLSTGVHLWDGVTGDSSGVLAENPSSLQLLASGKLVFFTEHKPPKLWDIDTLSWISTLSHRSGLVYKVKELPDGRLLSLSSDNKIRIWDGMTGQLISEMSAHASTVHDVQLLPNGRFVSWSMIDGTIRIWDSAGGEPIVEMVLPSGRLFGLRWLDDGRLLTWGYEICLWHGDSGVPLTTIAFEASHADILENGLIVASSFYGKTLYTWHAESGDVAATMVGHSAEIKGFQLVNHRLHSWSPNEVIIWDDFGKLVGSISKIADDIIESFKDAESMGTKCPEFILDSADDYAIEPHRDIQIVVAARQNDAYTPIVSWVKENGIGWLVDGQNIYWHSDKGEVVSIPSMMDDRILVETQFRFETLKLVDQIPMAV